MEEEAAELEFVELDELEASLGCSCKAGDDNPHSS